MKRFKGKVGFTIVEVLFASAVMLIGTSLLVSLTVNVAQFSEEERMQNEIERETSLLLAYIQRDVKSSVTVVADYPGVSTYYGSSFVLKVPEFDESGLIVADSYKYVVYEHPYDSETTIRTVYDDAEGQVESTSIGIDVGECFLIVLVDGEPAYNLTEDRAASTVEVGAYRYDNVRNKYYNRSFVIASTLRNPE